MTGPADLVRVGAALERRTRHAVTGVGTGFFLASLDAVLDSRAARVAVDRTLESPLAQHAVATALRGPLMDAMLTEVDQVADRVLDSPRAEALVARVIDSPLLDEAVARLLESEELWILVDEVARSPAVTEAISHQGMGLADEVGEVVRRRSLHADERLERAARRLLFRRRLTHAPAAGAQPEP